MEIANYKKSIGWGLIILFSVFITNLLLSTTANFVMSGSLYEILNWWYLLSQIIQAAAVIFIAYNRKSQASIISKIGACLYSVLMLIYIFNRLSHIFTGESYLYFHGVSIYLNTFLFYAPGLLLLVWGLFKLWLPIKLVTTLMVTIECVGYMLLSYHLYILLSVINIIVIIAALTLTIVWFNLKPKAQSVQKHNIDLI